MGYNAYISKNKLTLPLLASLFVTASIIAPLVSIASVSPATPPTVTPTAPPVNVGPIVSVTQGITVFNLWSMYITWAFWIAAVVMVFYAGFLYLTSAGEEDRVTKARHQLIYAIVAMVIGIMAYGLPLLLTSILLGI